jgi:hypothetical protein
MLNTEASLPAQNRCNAVAVQSVQDAACNSSALLLLLVDVCRIGCKATSAKAFVLLLLLQLL